MHILVENSQKKKRIKKLHRNKRVDTVWNRPKLSKHERISSAQLPAE